MRHADPGPLRTSLSESGLLGEVVIGPWSTPTARTRDFLQAVWDSTDLINHVNWENAAVNNLLEVRAEHPRPDPASVWYKGTQWLTDEWNRLTAHTEELEPARIRHLAGEGLHNFRARHMRAELARLDGGLIRPALGNLEWSIHKRPNRHPLWYPYGAATKAYSFVKKHAAGNATLC